LESITGGPPGTGTPSTRTTARLEGPGASRSGGVSTAVSEIASGLSNGAGGIHRGEERCRSRLMQLSHRTKVLRGLKWVPDVQENVE